MSASPTVNRLRIIPRPEEFLNRNVGASGEIFFNAATNSLRVYSGKNQGGFEIARADLSNIANSDFLAKAEAAGVSAEGSNESFTLKFSADNGVERTLSSGSALQFISGPGIETTSSSNRVTITNKLNNFNRIMVSGQTELIATAQNSILTVAAGSNIVLSTDAVSNSLMISATAAEGSTSNSFEVIAVAGQTNVVATSPSSILTLSAGSNISITTDAETKAITFSSATATFNGLTEITSINLTVDQIYLPAITMLRVSNSGASAYLFDQYSGNNPTIYAVGGMTIAFKLIAQGHPFLIQNAAGQNFDTGLVHVSTAGVVSTEGNAQGKDSGTLYWKIPSTISGNYRYQCSVHAPMVGSIVVKNIVTL
jgi:hypothetical protein